MLDGGHADVCILADGFFLFLSTPVGTVVVTDTLMHRVGRDSDGIIGDCSNGAH